MLYLLTLKKGEILKKIKIKHLEDLVFNPKSLLYPKSWMIADNVDSFRFSKKITLDIISTLDDYLRADSPDCAKHFDKLKQKLLKRKKDKK